MLLVAKCKTSSWGSCCLSVYPQAYVIIKPKLVIYSGTASLTNANKPFPPSLSVLYLNLIKSVSVETGKTLSSEQSPMSIANQALHKKCHFCPVCKSCTTTVPTNLRRRWQNRNRVDILKVTSTAGANVTEGWARCGVPQALTVVIMVKNLQSSRGFWAVSDFSVFAYHAGLLPELLCQSLTPCRSPREKGTDSRNTSTAPRSNTCFSGSVRWWDSLFPSAPISVAIT